MIQMTEQNETPEQQLSEVEIGNVPEKGIQGSNSRVSPLHKNEFCSKSMFISQICS